MTGSIFARNSAVLLMVILWFAKTGMMKKINTKTFTKLWIYIAFSGVFSLSLIDSYAQEIEWEKSFGSFTEDSVLDFVQLSDGSIVSVGKQFFWGDPPTYHDTWIIKTSVSGEEIWQRSFGGYGLDVYNSIDTCSDGGFFVTGFTNSQSENPNDSNRDFYLTKCFDNGNAEWSMFYGSEGSEVAYDGIQTVDGGFIAVGNSNAAGQYVSENFGGNDVWVVKVDEDGELAWEKSFGGSGSERGHAIIPAVDGGFIVVGLTSSNDGDVAENAGAYDSWVFKIDSSGELQWEMTFGGGGDDFFQKIENHPDGGYVVLGQTTSNDGDVSNNHGESDVWLARISNEGELIWEQTYGGDEEDIGQAIKGTSDGGFVVASSSKSSNGDVQNALNSDGGNGDYWALKLSENGEIEWERMVGGSSFDVPTAVCETADGFLFGGYSYSSDGDISGWIGEFDFWLVKLNPPTVGLENASKSIFNVYPNPASNVLNLEVDFTLIESTYRIYNSVGQLIDTGRINTNNAAIEIASLTTGIYVIQLQNEQGVFTATFVKE